MEIMQSEATVKARVSISLEKSDYEMAKLEAKKQDISLVEFVRRAVHCRLPAARKLPWMGYAGLVQSGDPRSSATVDEVVY